MEGLASELIAGSWDFVTRLFMQFCTFFVELHASEPAAKCSITFCLISSTKWEIALLFFVGPNPKPAILSSLLSRTINVVGFRRSLFFRTRH